MRKQLVTAMDTEGLLLHETGAYDAAADLFKRQLEHCEAMLAIDSADPAMRRLRSIANDRISVVMTALGDLELALEHNKAALQERAELVSEFPLNAEYQRALYAAHFQDGAILARLGRPREALQSYERNLAIVETLLATDPKNELYRSDRGHAMVRIGDMLVVLEDIPGALTRYRASLAIRSAESDADPSNLFKRTSLVEAQAKLAKALARYGEHASAGAQSTAALVLLEAMTLEPTYAGLRAAVAERYADLGEVYSIIAATQSRRGADATRADWRRALDMYRRSAAIWLDLRERGILAEANAAELDAVNREIARCSAALSS